MEIIASPVAPSFSATLGPQLSLAVQALAEAEGRRFALQ